MTKPVKQIRRTIVAVFKNTNVPVATRVMQWEDAARGYNTRRVHRVEYAGTRLSQPASDNRLPA